jgi:hypothetical protein
MLRGGIARTLAALAAVADGAAHPHESRGFSEEAYDALHGHALAVHPPDAPARRPSSSTTGREMT